MAQYFYINQNSELPYLRMELINDGNHDFEKSYTLNNDIQNADVYFSMEDEDGILKISNAHCDVFLSQDSGCEEKYIIQYRWNKRDTKKKGTFKGTFNIKFKNDLTEEGYSYPSGELLMPIYEDLYIQIK